MIVTRRISAALCGAVALLAGFSVGSAQAAVTCDFNPGTGALNVTVTAGTPTVAVFHGESPSTDIQVDDDFNAVDDPTVACTGGTPTESTTSTITVDESGSVQGTFLRLNYVNGRLAPGTGDSETGLPEIEVIFSTDGTGQDTLQVDGTTEAAAQSFRFGAFGGTVVRGNLNGDDDADDVAILNPNLIAAIPGTSDDTITANGSGSPSFTGPVPVSTQVFASDGDDEVAGGNGTNNFTGGAGDDTMVGGPGVDSFHMAEDDDTFDGGDGTGDFASYENDESVLGATIDLSDPDPQDTGGFGIDQVINAENVVGSNGPDEIGGTDGANLLFGGNFSNDAGNDVLNGRDGADTLSARKGDDLLIGGPGDDVLQGDDGVDTASYELGSTGPVTASLSLALTGMTQATGGAGSDTFADGPLDVETANHEIENLTGSPFGGDLLTGNGLANRISSWDGPADTVDCVAAGDDDVAETDEVGVDAVSNCETIDTAPQTAFEPGGPADGAVINDPTPTYPVSADETATFEYRVGNGPFQPCAGDCNIATALPDGVLVLSFRAVDSDEAGNPDATPVSRTVTIDTAAPLSTIQSGPAGATADSTPTFGFASEAGVVFECRVDSQPFAACTGPGATHTAATPLPDGPHTFQVRATDAAGNVETPGASRAFTVDTAAPNTTVSGRTVVKSKQKRAVVRLALGATEAGSTFQCALDGAAFSPCSSPFTARLKRGRHTLLVRATDSPGNTDTSPASVRVLVKKAKGKRPKR